MFNFIYLFMYEHVDGTKKFFGKLPFYVLTGFVMHLFAFCLFGFLQHWTHMK